LGAKGPIIFLQGNNLLPSPSSPQNVLPANLFLSGRKNDCILRPTGIADRTAKGTASLFVELIEGPLWQGQLFTFDAGIKKIRYQLGGGLKKSLIFV
jgi:hypothetical protein